MRRLAIILMLLAPALWAQTYSTTFPTTQNPISSQNGTAWISGSAATNWNDVRVVSPGFVVGTAPLQSTYADSTAIVAGAWGADQTVTATVHVTSVPGTYHEVELRLRTLIGVQRGNCTNTQCISGYEVDCSVASSNGYIEIVRWNGQLGSFTYIVQGGGGGQYCHDGDVLSATITGSNIVVTLTRGASVVATVTGSDSTFSSGSPGVGFYSTDSTSATYGFSSFSATSGGGGGPYDLPNDDSGCPGTCRQIPWSAGSDLWNGGTLPNYIQDAACTGLTPGDGTTNNAAAINACITAAASGHAVFIPAGIYYVNSQINMKSNVALRGAKASGLPFLPTADAAATTFKLGASGAIRFGSSSNGSNVSIASGYTKGSTSIVMNAGHGFVTGDYIIVSENPDTAIPVTKNGDDGDCNWCGENDGVHLMAQIVQATNVSGNNVTLGRPLYYTFKSGLSPVARKIIFTVQKAGLENIRMDGSFANHPAFIFMASLYSWVKGVETYDAGSGAKNSHVESEWAYGSEIRDNYFHFGRDSSSDRNYGIAFLFINSDHKVENNILRNHRHSTDFEGGGSGIAILYNYIDDDYTDDTSYLGSARANHGAHPYMNLYEGNIYSHLTADSYWGSSSHNVLFRNWLWGNETSPVAPGVGNPNWGFTPLDIWYNQNYYAAVGNVIGFSGGSGMVTTVNWSSYIIRTTSCSNAGTAIYSYGCNSNGQYSAATNSGSINHGNYDYKTNGVAYWEGGSNHTLKNSMYYGSKPGFFGTCAWPAFGPDLNPIVNTIPARVRYTGGSCGLPPPPQPPVSPSGIRVVIN